MMLTWSIWAFLVALYTLVLTIISLKRLQSLETVAPAGDDQGDKLPLVSVIIPACNEADNIKTTVHGLLQQQYPNLEIILVNDRSSDKTGGVIEELAASHSQVQSLHIQTLPEDWLGKNHALHCGAARASGDYFLFTDADVCLEKTTLSRAISHVLHHNLDHLTLLFRNTTSGGLLNGVIVEAMTGLLLVLRPWRVKEKNAKYFIGIGAFNLVRKTSYYAVGGHKQNALHPIDDIILGKTLHESGFLQDCLRGEAFVTVDWYRNLGDMIGGLMKNVFAFYNFNIFFSLAGAGIILFFSIFPFLGVFFCSGLPKLVCLLTVACKASVFLLNSRAMKQPPGYVLWLPIAVVVLLYISLRATVKTLKDDGIYWRGTYYPLQQLRTAQPIITLRWLFKTDFLG